MSKLVAPHGGEDLKSLLVPESERAAELKRAETLKQVHMTSRETSDVLMFAMAAYTPLNGFMDEADWRGVCSDMRLSNGTFWPIPITLSTTEEIANNITNHEEIALVDSESDKIMALMHVSDKFGIDKNFECQNVYATLEEAHPGVAKVMEQKEVNLGGSLRVLREGIYKEQFPNLHFNCAEARALFDARGWSRVAAFQTRNPMHRSHEHLAKIAIEITDGVFIHQVLGKLKVGDIPAETRTRAIQAMIDNYFVEGTVIQGGYPIEMRYAGPREALLHALVRQNFGCSHLIVGRDHAGVGDYYGPFDAHHIFDTLWDGALKTQALKIDIAFYSYLCGGMATGRTCPSDESQRLNISGTRLREMLVNGEEIPEEFSRPEVVRVLQEFYANEDL
ncbi:MAG: sulfate adenylyltransferase [Magnetovibrio sp.]|nr:sulfate adenylyltransferase [Magnetovibrio sp.]|tara:strand:+ start:2015 stop:3190 length:1176 start_codon:yes stop_codon:yes gene_type:complete